MESDSILRNLVSDWNSSIYFALVLSLTSPSLQIIVQRLFQPNEAVNSCSEYIRYQYTLYTRLLHRYLENKYHDGEQASEKMHRLSAILSERMPQIKLMLEGIFTEFTSSSQLSLVLGEMYQRPGWFSSLNIIIKIISSTTSFSN